MLSCTEFIPAYSELFKFIEAREGHQGVVKYWEFISDEYISDSLGTAVEKNGILGCFEYWSHTLNEEAADFTMTLDPDEGSFVIDMHYCPSKGRLLAYKHIEPYYDYCGHCDLLYRHVLEKYGFNCELDTTDTGKAACRLSVSANKTKL